MTEGLTEADYALHFQKSKIGRAPMFSHRLIMVTDRDGSQEAYVEVTRRVDGATRRATSLGRALKLVREMPIGKQ